MLNHLKSFFLLLLALPLAASADPKPDPVPVILYSEGGFPYPQPWLSSALGLPGPDLYYQMTVWSWIDTAAADFVNRGLSVSAPSSQLEVTLDVNGRSYNYKMTGTTNVTLTPNKSLVYDVLFAAPASPGVQFEITNTLSGDWGVGVGNALSPRDIETEGTNLRGYTTFSAHCMVGDSCAAGSVNAQVRSMWIRVSPVPEPASLGMLAAGFVVLGLRRRKVR